MRIGLLLCGETPEALQPEFGTYADCLTKRFQLYGSQAQVRSWHVWQGEMPDDVLAADAYVVGGSPASVMDRAVWIDRLSGFIRQAHRARRRLLGICFGHQVIHHALGGMVERAAGGWGLGVYPVQVCHSLPGLAPRKTLTLPAMHRDQVVRPAMGLRRYAGTDICPYYLMGHTTKILTIQGHPEFTTDFLRAFLHVARDRFDVDVLARATSSLKTPTDSLAMCQAINRFLLEEVGPLKKKGEP